MEYHVSRRQLLCKMNDKMKYRVSSLVKSLLHVFMHLPYPKQSNQFQKASIIVHNGISYYFETI